MNRHQLTYIDMHPQAIEKPRAEWPWALAALAVFAAIGILPLAPAADALRQIAVPRLAASGLLPVPVELAILAAMLAVFGVGSHFTLEYIERTGRAGGRLLTRAD